MKQILLMIAVVALVALVGCGNSDKVKLLEEENKRLKAEAETKRLEEKLKEKQVKAAPNPNKTAPSPNKGLTAREQNLIGTYDRGARSRGTVSRLIILNDGHCEKWDRNINGKWGKRVYLWKLVGDEVHIGNTTKDIYFLQPDKSLRRVLRTKRDPLSRVGGGGPTVPDLIFTYKKVK